MRIIKIQAVAAIAVAVVMGSCDLGGGGGIGVPDGGSGGTQTVTFEKQASGWYLFKTNDPDLRTANGITKYAYDDKAIEQGAFDYEVEVKKSSGDGNGGFGVVFQRTDKDHFLVWNIDVNGYYCVGKVVGPDITEIYKWTNGLKQLLPGYGVVNKLRVHFDGAMGYSLYANDSSEALASFNDDGNTYGGQLRGGCFGIDCEVLISERFPSVSVQAEMRVTNPAGFNVQALGSRGMIRAAVR